MRYGLWALVLALCAGCQPPPPPAASAPYAGPTESMAAVVRAINANNEKIPTLWATLNYTARVVDERKKEHFVSGDGVLNYQSPLSLRLIGNAAVGTVFDVGSNSQTYWLKLVPEIDTMWWGNYDDLSQTDASKLPIPIRPDYLLDVLAVGTINTDFNALPAPTMRFDPAEDAYDFLWVGRLPDRLVAVREVWYDRQTKQPKRVQLYDFDGRPVLRAAFGQFRTVQVDNVPAAQWPTVAGDYKLTFPDNGTRMEFTLDQIRLSTRSNGRTIPNPLSFRMPSQEGVEHVRRIGAE